MTKHDLNHYEQGAFIAYVVAASILLGAAGLGIALFSDREGFLRHQAMLRALAKEREAEREFGPVIPTSFNL